MDEFIKQINSIECPAGYKPSLEEWMIIYHTTIKRLKEISKGDPLAQMIIGYDAVSYSNIDDVISQLKLGSTDIYVYVEGAGKYLAFKDEKAFGMFVNNSIPPLNAETLCRGDFIKYQIVPNDRLQKLVLTYKVANEDVIKSIREYAKDYFGTDVTMAYNRTWNKNQLVVNIAIEKLIDGRKHFGGFKDYLDEKNPQIGNGLGLPPISYDHIHDIEYIEPLITHDPQATIIEHYGDSLVSSPNIAFICANKTIIPQSADLCDSWIKNNPPEDLQNTTVYYNKYKKDTDGFNQESIQDFSKRMQGLGYKNVKRTGGKHCWVKKMPVNEQPLIGAKPPMENVLRDADNAEDMEYIYLIITEPYQNLVKIGRSMNPEKRVRELQTGCPHHLVIYAVVQRPTKFNLEGKMHSMFADRRRQGEWFQFDEQELEMLRSTLELAK